MTATPSNAAEQRERFREYAEGVLAELAERTSWQPFREPVSWRDRAQTLAEAVVELTAETTNPNSEES